MSTVRELYLSPYLHTGLLASPDGRNYTFFCQRSITEHKKVWGVQIYCQQPRTSPPCPRKPHFNNSSSRPPCSFPMPAWPWHQPLILGNIFCLPFFFLLHPLPFCKSWHLLSLTFTIKSASLCVCARVHVALVQVRNYLHTSSSSILTLPNPTA